MLEQFSTALTTISTFHKNVEKILKKRKILSNIFKNVDKK
jgi:fluoride ion exporter CrcB/FEX